ncbi:MAG TPA: NUDIX domain-containing protein, partial [Woeseiaceae bacterium]|nr:NUDIX domain-containing protein [Woeseiaceae bacterium]
MGYTYEYPHPAVTVDVIVFTVAEEARLEVLLIRRAQYPFEGMWAMPGGFVGIDESLKRAAWRELKEETGVRAASLQQLGAFGHPDRDPRERIITVVYYSAIPYGELRFRADSDAADAALFDVAALPRLAADHNMIIGRAVERLRQQGADLSFALRFLPGTFTMAEYRSAAVCVLGRPLDKRNFGRKVRHGGWIEATGEHRNSAGHRPAALYR